MNVKITKEHHERLLKSRYEKHIFGSKLFGTDNENSDTDLLCVYVFKSVFGIDESDLGDLPLIHSLQYDDKENKTQYVWLTVLQFERNLRSGDSSIQADVVLFGEKFSDVRILDPETIMIRLRTTKVIRGYLGVAKRDLKLHSKNPKKRFHAMRSQYIADCLMNDVLPTLSHIQEINNNIDTYLVKDMVDSINDSRDRLNKMVDDSELKNYNIPKTGDDLLDILLNTNNTNEFRYDK